MQPARSLWLRPSVVAILAGCAVASSACGTSKQSSEGDGDSATAPTPSPEPAQGSAVTPASGGEDAAPEAAPISQPLLWRVSRGGKTSHLFGSMHLGVAPDSLDPAVALAFESSDALIVESNIAAGKAEELQKLAVLDGAETLQNKLAAGQWKTLRAALPDIPEEALARLEPWYVSVQVSARMMPAGEPMEAALVRRAKQSGKAISHLETWRAQVEAIEKATGLSDLQALLADLGKARADLERLLTLYRAGDEVGIRELAEALARDSGNPASVEILVDARNRAWLEPLAAGLGKGGAFAAVGAAHLAGDTGLLALLQARGFALERVAAKATAP